MSCDELLLSLATPGVAGLKPYLPGKPLEELKREYGINDAVKLASNENPLGPSKQAIAAMQDAFSELSRYPDGNSFALKNVLSQHLDVAPQQLVIGNGSNDVLEMIARAFLRTGDEAIFSEHAFAVYPIVTQAVGAQCVQTPAKNWGYDLDAISQAITENTRVIFVANPNNPTGTWTEGNELEAFIRSVPKDVLIVVDEAYVEYITELDFTSALVWLDQFPNLIVTRTFSKAYGLAGLRIGYGIAHPTLIGILNRVRQPFNVNSMALVAAEAALADKSHLHESIQLNSQGLMQLATGFDQLGLSYIPSVGNFVSVKVGDKAAEIYEKLLYAGVIVRPIANYGMPRYLRVSVGLQTENQRFLTALEDILLGLRQ